MRLKSLLSTLAAAVAASAVQAGTLNLDFSSPSYLGWAMQSVDSQAGETNLVSFLTELQTGSNATFVDGRQTSTAYRTTNTFASDFTTPTFVSREEDAGDVYDTFSISGLGYVIAKFGAGLQDPRTITGYSNGKNPKPDYSTSTHVWFLEVAGTDLTHAAISSNLQGLSHVTSFSPAPLPPASNVPDGGMTFLLLGAALVGLEIFRRSRA